MGRQKMVRVDIEGQEFKLSRTEARSLIGRMSAQMRDVYAASSPGRPRRVERCPCGAMSVARAAKRGHKCEAEVTA